MTFTFFKIAVQFTQNAHNALVTVEATGKTRLRRPWDLSEGLADDRLLVLEEFYTETCWLIPITLW